MDHLHWRHLLAKPLATMTVTFGSATSVFTCLGHFGQFDSQGKYILRDIAGVIVGKHRQCKLGLSELTRQNKAD
jgi:hypothetical protein